jgi:hypothetical protein
MPSDDGRPRSFPLGRIQPRSAGPRVTSLRDPEQDLIVVDVCGKVTLQHLTAGLDTALDLGIAEFVLWNAVDGDFSRLAANDVETIVADVLLGPWAPQKWALLTRPGRSRHFVETLLVSAARRHLRDRVRTFVERDRALEWFGFGEAPMTDASADEAILGR